MELKSLRASLIIVSRSQKTDRLKRRLERQTLAEREAIVVEDIQPASRAKNLGANVAAGEYFVFMDEETELDRDEILEATLEILGRLDLRDAIGISWRVMPETNAFSRRFAGAFSMPQSFLAGQKIFEVPWYRFGAASFAVSRYAFEALEGFDENLGALENDEFAYRLSRIGGKLYLLPASQILRLPRQMPWEAVKMRIREERANAYLVRKHPELALRSGRPAGGWFAALYLVFRTLFVIPLCFVHKKRGRHRLCFCPFSAMMDCLGDWIYARAWFSFRTAALSPGLEARKAVSLQENTIHPLV